MKALIRVESDLSASNTTSRDTVPVNALPEAFVFLQLGPREVAVGEGPFVEAEEPPPGGDAFYWNDFDLSSPRPWKIPRSFRLLSDLEVWSELPEPVIEWDTPSRASFDAAFETIARAFGNGAQLEKLVPVITERGDLRSGDPRALAPRALEARGGQQCYGYGRWDENGGMIGVTPERFLRISAEGGETVALAGTSLPGDAVRFSRDPKQIREHALVVEGIRSALEHPLLSEEPRELLELDGLLHFRTRLRWPVEARDPLDLNALIRRLHPTPAVGYLPRSAKVSALHRQVRDQLTPPEAFAAPLGCWRSGRFDSVVAIRQIGWEGRRVALPSGCGLIRESDPALEWDELAFKRRAVKHFLRL